MATASHHADTPLVDRLRALADQRHRDPAEAAARAQELLDGLPPDDPAWPTGHWVLGLTHHELGALPQALASYRAAVRSAVEQRDVHTESLARAGMAISLLSLGDASAAEREIARAGDLAPPSARGLVDLLVALVLQRTGQLDASLAAYRRALTRLRRAGDDANVARLLLNRGTLRAYQGEHQASLADLRESERLATEHELWVLVAMAAHNLGFALGRRGDVPSALAAFDRAEAAYASQGDPPRLVAALASDRCEVFLSVGLARDAAEAAERALLLLGAQGDASHHAEARLLLARARLAQGDVVTAGVEAAAAARSFRSARRAPWAAVAEYVGMQAEIVATQDDAEPPFTDMLARTRRIARLLEVQGWPVEALHVRTFLARVALALDRPEVARRELADVVGDRRRGSAQLRVEAWHATALLRLADDDRAGAKRALRRGLAVVDEHRAALGATELRSGPAAQAAELARLGLRLAVREGRPAEVIQWVERWRAGTLRLPAVAPPDDAALTAALQDLREARSDLRHATLEGDAAPGLATQITRLEAVVRSRTMRASSTAVEPPGALDLAGLRACLGATSLVELIALEGRLLAVTLIDGRARLQDLAGIDEVALEQGYLRAALRRLLVAPEGDPSATSASRAVGATAARLDQLLISPLHLPDGPVVIVPTGALHGLSWAALPSLSRRALTVSPSAELWHRRSRSANVPAGRVALVAGPDLPGGDREVRRLARHYPGANVLRGAAASAVRVRDAIEGADLVHMAAHGTFRADAPLFSALRLADGPLTVYELERLAAAPDTLILPACDAALLEVRPGDELLGTAAALLSLGVASVVAPLLPVPDVATAPLMLSLHERLRQGSSPSAALAEAAAERDDPVALAFVCIGAGEGSAP
jgi:tetratricopeptide (TPR) repeat protein